MKLMPSLLVLVISGIVLPVAVAAQQGAGTGMERGQKARPDPVVASPSVIQSAANTVKLGMMFDGECNVVQTTDNNIGWEGGFYPAGAVGVYFNNVQHVELDTSKAKVSVLREPRHGKLINTGKVGDGPYYEYRATSGYLGSDEATLLIEIDGKSYTSQVKFYVVEKVNDNNFYGWDAPATRCAESQPRRVATLTFNQDICLAQGQ